MKAFVIPRNEADMRALDGILVEEGDPEDVDAEIIVVDEPTWTALERSMVLDDFNDRLGTSIGPGSNDAITSLSALRNAEAILKFRLRSEHEPDVSKRLLSAVQKAISRGTGVYFLFKQRD